MEYPKIRQRAVTRETVEVFRGYNHNLRIGEGEFYDMENLSSDDYPVLSPRKKRGFLTGGSDIRGLIAKEKLCWVDGTDFVMDGTHYPMDLTDEEKSLVGMGAYVIILPDKQYINTVDPEDRGAIGASVTTSGTVKLTTSRADGTAYDVTFCQDTAPENPENGQQWLDTSGEKHLLKQYSAASGLWVTLMTTCVRLEAPGLGRPFREGDGVTISGLGTQGDSQVAALDGSFVIQSRGENHIVVAGLLDQIQTVTVPVTVERTMPELDFVIESGNRLWGCRYGPGKDGQMVNEIYASKLGDFRNWQSFQGISTDSYRASLGSDGPFTGAICYGGYPLFFKEACLHKVYGSYPAQYQIQTVPCRGVQKGSHNSLAIVNEVLYYKSRLGVCAYDGSLPNEISDALGPTTYSGAVGGAHGSKYYISMMDGNFDYHLFVYDAARGMWHREDKLHVRGFASCDNEMYYIDAADGCIHTLLGSGSQEDGKVEWHAVTGLMGMDSPDKKHISQLQIRMQMELDAQVKVSVQYDSCGVWEHICTVRRKDLHSFQLPVRPRRCDHLRLKLEGRGSAKVFSICKTVGHL